MGPLAPGPWTSLIQLSESCKEPWNQPSLDHQFPLGMGLGQGWPVVVLLGPLQGRDVLNGAAAAMQHKLFISTSPHWLICETGLPRTEQDVVCGGSLYAVMDGQVPGGVCSVGSCLPA